MLRCMDLTKHSQVSCSSQLITRCPSLWLQELACLPGDQAVSEGVAGHKAPEAADGAEEAEDDHEEGDGDPGQCEDDDVPRQGLLQTRRLTPSHPGPVLNSILGVI